MLFQVAAMYFDPTAALPALVISGGCAGGCGGIQTAYDSYAALPTIITAPILLVLLIVGLIWFRQEALSRRIQGAIVMFVGFAGVLFDFALFFDVIEPSFEATWARYMN